MKLTFRRIAILGPGLLGGSIALALRSRYPEVTVTGWARRKEAASELVGKGVAHTASDKLEEVVPGADLVVLCTPIGAMPDLATRMLPLLEEDAVVTDVGSVKGTVIQALRPILGSRFVGSHPMAGSDQAGLHAARADLFQGAACILTPTEDADPQAVASLEQFWSAIGAKVCRLSPERHDEVVAWISHLPHLMASALVNLVCSKNADALKYCGSGFRDTTRVASGPAGMWAEILEQNRDAMQQSLRAMIEHLQSLEKMLGDTPRMEAYLAEAKIARDRLKQNRSHGALES